MITPMITLDGKLETIEHWLRETQPERLQVLYQAADQLRHERVGAAVHLRGLIEFSNYCLQQCWYCGLRAPNQALARYRMTEDEILECVREIVTYGYGTVVLQSGEDRFYSQNAISQLIRRIKTETSLAVTLSLGERDVEELAAWRQAGADRYLLRFETSNPTLFAAIHPPVKQQPVDRMALLRELKKLGYEVGSGVMIGIPGQSYGDLARDIAWFQQLDLEMIGVGPWIAHPATPLGQAAKIALDKLEQVPNTEEMVYKVVALTRLLCPGSNIPATTAIATLNTANGRELALQRGANIVMPIMTPTKFRELYEIYPDKACANESAEECRHCLQGRIHRIGRVLGQGRGDARNKPDSGSILE